MKSVKRLLSIVLLLILCVSIGSTRASEAPKRLYKPIDNNGVKWRIGYCETEPFSNYAAILHSIILAFGELGWVENIETMPYQDGQDDSKEMWEWLSKNSVGDFIEFPVDAHYTLSSMQTAEGIKPEEEIIKRLNTKSDIDFMIVMGTKAGTLLGNDKHNVNTFVFSASNAYASGIVKGIDYSGNSHVWAHTDIDRFKRQVRVFDDVFQIDKLGIVYENSEIGKTYTALGDIEAVAKERGFTIESEFVKEPQNNADIERYRLELKAAYEKLSKKVDAFYITIASINPKWLPELLEPFYKEKVPVFSQMGSDEVKYGALMSITLLDFPNMGRFGADTIIKAIYGEKLDTLSQKYENTPQIILNLETAKKVEYKPSFDIMLVADRIFNKIER